MGTTSSVQRADRASQAVAEGTQTVQRWDRADLGAHEVLPNGYLRCDARISKVGVFEYVLADGTIRRELRPPAEVFAADSIASFSPAPLTVDHPPVPLDPKNTRELQVGVVSDVRVDGEYLRAKVMLTDDEAITCARNSHRELSCGYTCVVHDTAGVTHGLPGVPDGLTYDAIQTEIRANHVALVERGRAGPDVRLRLDGEGVMVMQEAAQKQQMARQQELDLASVPTKPTLSEVRIDGIGYVVPSETAAVVNRRINDLQERCKMASDELQKYRARADELQARVDALTDPELIQKAVQTRLELERQAGAVLGDEIKLDSLTDEQIMRAVVLKVSPAAEGRLDNCEPVYLRARYEAAVETAARMDAQPLLAAVRVAGLTAGRTDSAEDARARMIAAHHKMGREQIAGA